MSTKARELLRDFCQEYCPEVGLEPVAHTPQDNHHFTFQCTCRSCQRPVEAVFRFGDYVAIALTTQCTCQTSHCDPVAWQVVDQFVRRQGFFRSKADLSNPSVLHKELGSFELAADPDTGAYQGACPECKERTKLEIDVRPYRSAWVYRVKCLDGPHVVLSDERPAKRAKPAAHPCPVARVRTKATLVTLVEKFDLERANVLLRSAHVAEEHKQLLRRYLTYYRSGLGGVTVLYHLEDYGRFHGCVGPPRDRLQWSATAMKRELRNFLFAPKYTDIDIRACHTVLAQQLCHKFKVATPVLDGYLRDRATLEAEFMAKTGADAEATKELFHRIKFGGGFAAWATEFKVDAEEKDFPLVTQLRQELLAALHLIIPRHYTELMQWVEQERPDRQPWQSSEYWTLFQTFAFVMQTKEREILQLLVQRAGSEGYRAGSLIHDGCTLETTDTAQVQANHFTGKVAQGRQLRVAHLPAARPEGRRLRVFPRSVGVDRQRAAVILIEPAADVHQFQVVHGGHDAVARHARHAHKAHHVRDGAGPLAQARQQSHVAGHADAAVALGLHACSPVAHSTSAIFSSLSPHPSPRTGASRPCM